MKRYVRTYLCLNYLTFKILVIGNNSYSTHLRLVVHRFKVYSNGGVGSLEVDGFRIVVWEVKVVEFLYDRRCQVNENAVGRSRN